jgi:hypothetical protein
MYIYKSQNDDADYDTVQFENYMNPKSPELEVEISSNPLTKRLIFVFTFFGLIFYLKTRNKNPS